MTESEAPIPAPTETPGTASPSSSSSRSSAASSNGPLFRVLLIGVAVWGIQVVRTFTEAPWQYRFWGIVAIVAAVVLPQSVTDKLTDAVIERAPFGKK